MTRSTEAAAGCYLTFWLFVLVAPWCVLLAVLLAGCDVPLLEGCHTDADCPPGEPAGYDGPYPHAGYHYACDGYNCYQVEECAPPAKPPDAPVLIPPGFYTPPVPESETAMPETSTKEFPFKNAIITQQGADIDATGKLVLPGDNNPPKASNINLVGEQLVSLYQYGRTDAAARFVVGNGPGATYTPTAGPIVIDGTGFGGVIGAPLTAAPSQATGILVQSPIDAREGVVVREGIRLLGGDPAVDMDVGADNLFYAANVPKAWCEYDVQDDADTDEVRLKTGINVESTVTGGNIVTVTFVRPMSQPFYHVDLHLTFNITTGGPEIYQFDITNKTQAGFKVSLYKLNLSTGGSSNVGVTWGTGKGFTFSVEARQ